MRGVRQEDLHGCGVACVAMVLGITYQEARKLWGDRRKGFEEKGLSLMSMDRILALAGYSVQRIYKADAKVWPPEPWAEFHICLVDVVKRLPAGRSGHHLVVMDAVGTVHDPDLSCVLTLKAYATCTTLLVSAGCQQSTQLPLCEGAQHMSQPVDKETVIYILYCLLHDACAVANKMGMVRPSIFLRRVARKTNDRWKLDQYEDDDKDEKVAVKAEEAKAITKLEELAAHGCLTGDCPHAMQVQCDKALADAYREAFNV